MLNLLNFVHINCPPLGCMNNYAVFIYCNSLGCVYPFREGKTFIIYMDLKDHIFISVKVVVSNFLYV